MSSKKNSKVTQESADRLRKVANGRRICITKEGYVKPATLEEIKKHGYRLVEDVTMTELGLEDFPHGKEFYGEVKKMNAIIESGENKIEE